MSTRRRAWIGALIISASLLSACAAAPSGGDPEATSGRNGDTARTVEIYAAVIDQLVTEDNTFGGRGSPFEHVYIVASAVEGAAPMSRGQHREPLDAAIQTGLRHALAELAPLDFVSDPRAVRSGAGGPVGVEHGGVIIILGPIVGTGDRVEVETSLWCGNLCGQWLTYVLEFDDGRWTITGTTGSRAIS